MNSLSPPPIEMYEYYNQQMAALPRCEKVNIVLFDLDKPDNLDKIDAPYHIMARGCRWDIIQRAIEIMHERMSVKCQHPMFRLEAHL